MFLEIAGCGETWSPTSFSQALNNIIVFLCEKECSTGFKPNTWLIRGRGTPSLGSMPNGEFKKTLKPFITIGVLSVLHKHTLITYIYILYGFYQL